MRVNVVFSTTAQTSLAQHSHSYGMDSEIFEPHCHLHTVFFA